MFTALAFEVLVSPTMLLKQEGEKNMQFVINHITFQVQSQFLKLLFTGEEKQAQRIQSIFAQYQRVGDYQGYSLTQISIYCLFVSLYILVLHFLVCHFEADRTQQCQGKICSSSFSVLEGVMNAGNLLKKKVRVILAWVSLVEHSEFLGN